MTLYSDKITKEMINYFNKDVKRINHALKVYSFCKTIGALEQLNDNELMIVNLSGILHDIGIKEAEKKYNSSAGPYQEKEGPAIAKEIMNKYDIDKNIIERVCYIIGHHHSYSKIDGLDFQILVEADFLVNIYEDEMDKNAITSVKNKYFKTKTGSAILEDMYL
ncbi:metal-dependent phosphohydrolase HD sub domain [Ruminiclostridium papyrosolvens DSM 2782]|uniref:Metal-dependent phosphohydrolase HD sub domain n=1 Tax=Ruminiclostridium papyrosolvens DSM 2782 TaxID=588581 RepID=F1TEK3_9FIRM|nr:HD domain-containing protein [Ruminiclostridium papyrosolvens]EGD47169.1 metal-dependent phosphohydrolase HD sub domain [Ruminiclostridium papyrosolvens DSM 2782]WES36209.1 HD domain-containing protein [Ruminiclostridium papyrosolvens DSM 2782]